MKRVLYYLAKMAGIRVALVPYEHINSPNTLNELCLTRIVGYLQDAKFNRKVLHTLPDNVLLNVYLEMLVRNHMYNLSRELSDLNIFERLLRHSGNHLHLLHFFQAIVEHGDKLSDELATAYLNRCDDDVGTKDSLINLGLRLGGFLNEAGWYEDAQRVLICCRDLCLMQPQSTYYKRLTLECCHRLLYTQSAYCCFPAAAQTYSLALALMGVSKSEASETRVSLPVAIGTVDTCTIGLQTESDDELDKRSWDESAVLPRLCEEFSALSFRLPKPESTLSEATACLGASTWGESVLVARLCKEFSTLFFVRCDYTLAHAWAGRALRLLTPDTPPKVTVEVLRACAKASVVKRRFGAAGAAARHAVGAARRAFGPRHPRYAAALLDYGFYLLNIDSIVHSVSVYEEALGILKSVFGSSSLHVATAQEDLAYALYVLEYSSGRFYKARDHAERAIKIIEDLVPSDHLLLASAKRVKALILEEIALDTPVGGPDTNATHPTLLEESEVLHRAALALSMMAFGEKNVQTAKHYGNLGRLYQSMQKFQDAETMHLKAIAIKEELLGEEDYEVGLSIGHLASLYNYHMNMHTAAEKLYLRSISISMKLFGERYSGLEYDYRGLVHVFTQLKQRDQAEHYNNLLQHWSELREQSRAEPQPVLGREEIIPLEELRAKFFAPND